MKIRVDWANQTSVPVPRAGALRLCESLFKRFAKHSVVKRQNPTDKLLSHLSIVIVGTKAGREINRRYRGKDRPTDILSFEPGGPGLGLGELVLCGPVIRRQAGQHGLSFKHEMDYLLIHGFLHLLGYDHERSRREEAVMMKLQDQLFEELSFRRRKKKRS
jgi:probable rRNA maturation factor